MERTTYMNKFKIGYASTDITPHLGIAISGYYVPRFAKEILDGLEVNALSLSCDGDCVIWVSIDNCMIDKTVVDRIAKRVQTLVGIPAYNVIVSVTHTHTAPFLTGSVFGFEPDEDEVLRYTDFVIERAAEAARLAYSDMLPAKMGYAVVRAPERIAYIRRYKMKDGSTMTCPPVNDPNIDHPLGELDQRVNVLRFDREGGESIVLLNYGLHADTVGGEMISADWPGQLRKTLDKALDGVKCIVICGAQGDVGSTNIHPTESDMNDTEISFDNEMKSPGMARFVGRALAGAVLEVYDKVNYTDVNDISVLRQTVAIPTNMPEPEDMPRAKEYKRLHDAGRDDLIPYTAMELTTVVAEAARMCELEHGPETIPMEMVGVSFGCVALIGIPGEPFTEIGVKIKEMGGFDLIMPCALTNGYYGYFPMRSAYDEGGYEARASKYRSGVAERLIECGGELLRELSK